AWHRAGRDQAARGRETQPYKPPAGRSGRSRQRRVPPAVSWTQASHQRLATAGAGSDPNGHDFDLLASVARTKLKGAQRCIVAIALPAACAFSIRTTQGSVTVSKILRSDISAVRPMWPPSGLNQTSFGEP